MRTTGSILFPAPLQAGDVIGITAPSSGVAPELVPRLDYAVKLLADRGFSVRLGQCLIGGDVVSASAGRRAEELMAFLLDPQVRAVVPPWGGELAVEILPHLDFDALAGAEPTWLVGYSDISTVLLALSTRLGWGTLHGQNLMDTPYVVPEPLLPWLDIVTRPQPASFEQGPSRQHRRGGFDDWAADPTVNRYRLDAVGTWRPLDPPDATIRARGRLVGGCIETVSMLAGTRYGDVAGFARRFAPEGTILYLEAAQDGALTIARDLWRIRLAGWLDCANAVLIGRTSAPAEAGFTQQDAVRSALAGYANPVLLDVDCGHVPPHLALVNGALAELTWAPGSASLTQHLR